MAKSSNYINPGSKTSTAHVAPLRSEIRIPFVADVVSFALAVRRTLSNHSLAITFVLVATLTACRVLGVSLPVWAAVALAVSCCVGCLHVLARIFAEAELFEQQQKGGEQ